jgi:hypothetical protein
MTAVGAVPGMGEVKVGKSGGWGEFNYDVFDILWEILQISWCTLSTTIIKKSMLGKKTQNYKGEL